MSFETSISTIIAYISHLQSVINTILEDCIDREDIFKLLNYSKRLLYVIQGSSKGVNLLSTDIYTFLRKISQAISDHDNSNIFFKDKTFKELKLSCQRNFIYLEEKYSQILVSAINPNYEMIKVEIDLSFFVDIPKTPENNFTSLTKHDNEIYFFETDDFFQFLYFFKGVDDMWYWSPPKNKDPKDVWIKVPLVKISEGYWAKQKIQKHIEDFMIWLAIFNPRIPEK